MVAGLAALAVALGGCTTPSADAEAQHSPTPTTATAAASPSAGDSPSASPTPFTGLLKVGSSGEPVARLQQRLAELGYWNGPNDAKFGGLTQQAVWALQKAAGIPRSGTTTPATWAALDAGTRPTARSTSGHVIEVDLKKQLLLFVTGGHVDTILNTSTGGGYKYTSEGVTSVAITPKGHFTTNRFVDGVRIAPLGELYRPRYFFDGYAIHGAASVPPTPASHGCVRVTNAAMNWVWAQNIDPVGTPVWIY
jgi:lipoprotein-anchoring transpeptidase ErfK/SrfK